MSDTYYFKCDRCGLCCENTVVKTELGRFGVFILPHERIFFPQQYIKPMFGLGVKGHARPRPQVIYAYQNISQPCIWYEPDSRDCLIYSRRPLGCMEFPLSAYHGMVMLHRECPQMAKLIPEGVSLRSNQVRGLEVEILATHKMNIYFASVFMVNIYNVDLTYTWAYDIDKNKWVQWKEDQLVQYLESIDKKVNEN